MAKTISEQLQDKLGKKVECSECKQKKILNANWCITQFKDPVCPSCCKTIDNKRFILLGI